MTHDRKASAGPANSGSDGIRVIFSVSIEKNSVCTRLQQQVGDQATFPLCYRRLSDWPELRIPAPEDIVQFIVESENCLNNWKGVFPLSKCWKRNWRKTGMSRFTVAADPKHCFNPGRVAPGHLNQPPTFCLNFTRTRTAIRLTWAMVGNVARQAWRLWHSRHFILSKLRKPRDARGFESQPHRY
jgi:hypothetical protein